MAHSAHAQVERTIVAIDVLGSYHQETTFKKRRVTHTQNYIYI